MMRHSPVVAGALIAGATLTAQQTTTFKSGVVAVRMDVSVVRGGQPIRGLSADDFVVSDNTVPQQVEQVAIDSLPLAVLGARLERERCGRGAGTLDRCRERARHGGSPDR